MPINVLELVEVIRLSCIPCVKAFHWHAQAPWFVAVLIEPLKLLTGLLVIYRSGACQAPIPPSPSNLHLGPVLQPANSQGQLAELCSTSFNFNMDFYFCCYQNELNTSGPAIMVESCDRNDKTNIKHLHLSSFPRLAAFICVRNHKLWRRKKDLSRLIVSNEQWTSCPLETLVFFWWTCNPFM